MGTPLTLTTIHRGATTIVAVCGELDLVTAPRLTDELAGIAGDVHLDCHRLTFLDCAGIGALIAAHQECRARGHDLVIHGLSPLARRTLQAVGLDHELNVAGRAPCPDVDGGMGRRTLGGDDWHR